MSSQEIFLGITTSELVGYKAMGDNSKELQEELIRRASIISQERKGKKNII